MGNRANAQRRNHQARARVERSGDFGPIVKPEAAEKVVAGLKEAGIDLITYLPETRLSEILPPLRVDARFLLVPVAGEAEHNGTCAGPALGGKQTAVYFGGTGAFHSALHLLAAVARYRVPVL